jgi:prepilin-type processing-associated H-X9-DG protein
MRGVISVAIVLLIVILSCGMFLPRLMRGREDMGRAGCMNNLRGLHVALFNYHDRHDAFPRAVAQTRELPPEERVSWVPAILPYLGHKALYAEIDNRASWDAAANTKALNTRLTILQCPSGLNTRPAPGNITHYPGMAGLGVDAARLPLDDPRAGCFGYYRDINLDYIRALDGSSATIMVMETAIDNGPWLAGGPPTARGLDAGRQPYIGSGGQLGGTHPAGAHALYADGSVQMHAPAMNPRVLEALITVGGTDE